jgi:hypothetical protein
MHNRRGPLMLALVALLTASFARRHGGKHRGTALANRWR